MPPKKGGQSMAEFVVPSGNGVQVKGPPLVSAAGRPVPCERDPSAMGL